MRITLLLLALALLGCDGCRDKGISNVDNEQVQKDLMASNKVKHQNEIKRISEFIARKQWPMDETATGLRYWIYQKGNGSLAKNSDVAVIAYTVEVMEGKKCYSADSLKPGSFLIGQDNVERGLHEAMVLMHVGDKVRLILPSHLAFGLTGDSDCIPPDASLVYDVHLIELQ